VKTVSIKGKIKVLNKTGSVDVTPWPGAKRSPDWPDGMMTRLGRF